MNTFIAFALSILSGISIGLISSFSRNEETVYSKLFGVAVCIITGMCILYFDLFASHFEISKTVKMIVYVVMIVSFFISVFLARKFYN